MMRWLRLRILRGWRQRRRHGHEWIARYPRCARWLAGMGCLHPDTSAVARGIAIGLLIGLTPTVGFQILLMLLGCTLLRGNFLAAFAVSWISNPLTMGPLYYGFNQVGDAVFAPLLAPLAGLAGLSGDITEESVTTFLGSLVIALPAAVVGYLFTLWALYRRRGRRYGAAVPVVRLSAGALPKTAIGAVRAPRMGPMRASRQAAGTPPSSSRLP